MELKTSSHQKVEPLFTPMVPNIEVFIYFGYSATTFLRNKNAKFLKEMLAALDSDTVQLKLSQPNRAGLILPTDNDSEENITMLIMPMMLNNY